MRKRAITATMLPRAAMAFSSGAKLYEDETMETVRHPQTDIEIPEANLWNAVPDSNTGTGH